MSNLGYSPDHEATVTAWSAPVAEGPVQATVTVPGSKSLTNRELVLAALADAPSRLIAPLHSDDSNRMIEALSALGVGIEPVEGNGEFGPDLHVTPASRLSGDTTVDCGQAGTVMRFVTPLTGLVSGEVVLTADANALHRPMGTMIKALRQVGVDIDDGGRWALPFTVRGHGHIRGGEVAIDASASSQFVSGLLLAAPRFDVTKRDGVTRIDVRDDAAVRPGPGQGAGPGKKFRYHEFGRPGIPPQCDWERHPHTGDNRGCGYQRNTGENVEKVVQTV